MKLRGDRLGAQENVSKCLQYENEWSAMLERHGRAFIAPPPQENLAVGVSETQTCPGRGPDMSDKLLWNLAWGPDMSDSGLSR
jgi:hypothetical protein